MRRYSSGAIESKEAVDYRQLSLSGGSAAAGREEIVARV
jgi:hypothetical protein